MKTKRSTIGMALILVLVVVLFATNPNETDFKDHLQKEMVEDSETEVGEVLTRLFSGPAAALVNLTTERNNYYLWSTYRFDTQGEEYVYLGILGSFIKLQP